MTDHGLMMTGDNVLRILRDLKTMTRRCPVNRYKNWKVGDRIYIKETYYEPGFWKLHAGLEGPGEDPKDYKWVSCISRTRPEEKKMVYYGIDNPTSFKFLDGQVVSLLENKSRAEKGMQYWRKMSSMFMPAVFARIRAEITELREEPLQSITYEDILAEGFNVRTDMPTAEGTTGEVARLWYRQLWDSLNKTRGFAWVDNPVVKVIGYKLLPATAGLTRSNSGANAPSNCE